METQNEDLDNEGRSDIPVDWPDAAAGPEAQTGEVKKEEGAGDGADASDKTDEEVEEESEESFPASDPPSW